MSESFSDLNWDQLMVVEAKQSEPLALDSEDTHRFKQQILLYKMDQQGYHLPVVPEDPNSGVSFLGDLIQQMVSDGMLELDSREYRISRQGKQELEQMAERYHSLVEHYDIFGHVDLDASCFLEPGDDVNEQIMIDGQPYPRFIDLRVAVMRFKGISPFDMVFLNLLREGRIAKGDNWEFDIALGDEVFKEVQEIVNTAYTVKDLTELGKTNEHGEIPGSDILKDVIVAGNQTNQDRRLAQEHTPGNDQPASDTAIKVAVTHTTFQQQEPLFVEYNYEPYGYYESYYDPFYVEPVWTHRRYDPWYY